MLYDDGSSGDVGCCIHRRHFYKFDGSGKKDQSQVALLSQTPAVVDVDSLGIAAFPKYCLTFLLER
jgi:hypothetical protein